MASVLKVLASPIAPPPLHQGKDTRDAVYVAAVPLRAAKGPAQLLMSAAYSLGSWDLQHFMVLVKPDPPQAPIFVFDFQPQDPENVLVALAVVSGRNIPGVILKRKLQRMPRSRCWFVGYSNGNSIDVANRFNKDWPTSLVVGKHDCRHYTDGTSPSPWIYLVNSYSSPVNRIGEMLNWRTVCLGFSEKWEQYAIAG